MIEYKLYTSVIDKIINPEVDFKQLEKNIIYIDFDFEKNHLIVNNKHYRVESDAEFTHKTLKTKIKAHDGLRGLQKFILSSSRPDDVFNGHTWAWLMKVQTYCKAVI